MAANVHPGIHACNLLQATLLEDSKLGKILAPPLLSSGVFSAPQRAAPGFVNELLFFKIAILTGFLAKRRR